MIVEERMSTLYVGKVLDALAADPAWPAYRAKNQPRIQSQETRIMRPPAFFEPVLRAMLKAGRR